MVEMSHTIAEPEHATADPQRIVVVGGREIIVPGGSWPRRLDPITVEPRGPRFRDRYRRVVAMGRTSDLTNAEVAFLHHLLDTGPGGRGRPIRKLTRAALADQLGVCERTIKRWTDSLRAKGYLDWTHRMARTAAGFICQQANEYVLMVPRWAAARLEAIGSKRPAPPPRLPRTPGQPRAAVDGVTLTPAEPIPATDPFADIDLDAIPAGMTVARYLAMHGGHPPP